MSEIYLPEFLSHTMLYRKKFRIEKSKFDRWYLILVESGCFEITILGRTFTVNDNEMCVIPANCYFERRIIEPIYHHEIHLTFNVPDEILKESRQYFAGKIAVTDQERLTSTIRHFSHLFDAKQEKKELFQHFINDIWYQIYTDRLWHAHDTRRHLLFGMKLEDKVVSSVLDYYEEHLDEKIVLGDLAQSLGITPVSLCRRFQKTIGCSPGMYLQKMRLQKGRCLLVDTKVSISKISEMCGFDNQFYFSNCFKREYGMAPSSYRRDTSL